MLLSDMSQIDIAEKFGDDIVEFITKHPEFKDELERIQTESWDPSVSLRNATLRIMMVSAMGELGLL